MPPPLPVRPCAVTVCAAAVVGDAWVCRRHWAMIPPVTQGALLWCRDHGDDQELARARSDALEAIEGHS